MVFAKPSDKFRCITTPVVAAGVFPDACVPPDSCAFAPAHKNIAMPAITSGFSAILKADLVGVFISLLL